MADYLTRQETQPIDFPANKAKLSIRLRPDGFSFAYAEEVNVRMVHILIPAQNPTDGLRKALFGPEWPDRDFDEVRVCVPTEKAALIPAGMDTPDSYNDFLTGIGIEVSKDTRIFSSPVRNDLTLLHAVCENVIAPLKERFGEKLTFFHPLAVSLLQDDTKGTVLQIDQAGGYAHYTLMNDANLLFCDVFPAENEATILFHINRMVVGNKIGAFRIVCSGDNATSLSGLLSGYYKDTGIHPNGENRNLIFPFQ